MGFDTIGLYVLGQIGLSKWQTQIRPQGYKTYFMLNSVEHEILNAPKYKILRNSAVFRFR